MSVTIPPRAPFWPACSFLIARLTNRLTQIRPFAASANQCAKSTKSKLRDDHADVPRYPYGPSRWYKQSNHGLYGGARIQYGNNVSGKTEIKTRRRWRPNVQRRALFSRALGRFVRVRVVSRVLRTIDKCGGLDEYLLGHKAARIKELGMGGWLLRWRLMQTPAVRSRFAQERQALGLSSTTPVKGNVGSGMAGDVISAGQLAEQVSAYDAALDRQGSTVPLGEADRIAVITDVGQDDSRAVAS